MERSNASSWIHQIAQVVQARPGTAGLFIQSLLVVVAAFRLVHLDADPGLIKSLINNASDVGDEGYWAAAARNLQLFHVFASDEYLQAATSPLYGSRSISSDSST